MALTTLTELQTLALVNQIAKQAAGLPKYHSLLEKGGEAQVTISFEGMTFTALVHHEGVGHDGYMANFYVQVPIKALQALKSPKAMASAIVGAAATLVQDYGMPEEAVVGWLATPEFRDAVLTALKQLGGSKTVQERMAEALSELL